MSTLSIIVLPGIESMRTLMFLFLMSTTLLMNANNIQVSNVSLTGQNTTEGYTLVEFDISWENSWRVVGGPGNWDAAWIFIKYKIGAGPWLHAWLNDAGHMVCAEASVTVGLLDPDMTYHETTNPGLGVFLYRSNPGSGTFACSDVQVRWNYGANDLSDNEQVDIKVFAIEHVYVPSGNFKVGTGGSEEGAFYTYPTSTNPYEITSEGEIPVGAQTGYLYYSNSSGYSGDQSGPIPVTLPKGHNDFYAMKHEISQKGYVDFLNSISRTQQIARVRTTITGTSITNVFVMSNASTVVDRNGIWTNSTIPEQPGQIFFQCNFNGNAIGDESGDGQNIACNYITQTDFLAYLDWAGLRPMTEFEFEKCGRGPISPVPGEFAWGDPFYFSQNTLTNSGFDNESPGTLANYNKGTLGPFRVGCFARSETSRVMSGATYYGALDFSGNLNEYIISAGSPAGRSYTGMHGDGLLSVTGYSNVVNWPNESSVGTGIRGGGFSDNYSFARLSNRSRAALSGIIYAIYSGRGVRVAPN